MADLIVVDASTLITAVTDATESGNGARDAIRGHQRHAPHLVDAEVGNVIRRMARRGDLTDSAAARARQLAERCVDRRYEHHGRLAERAWHFRENLTFYDALLRCARRISGMHPRHLRRAAGPGPARQTGADRLIAVRHHFKTNNEWIMGP